MLNRPRIFRPLLAGSRLACACLTFPGPVAVAERLTAYLEAQLSAAFSPQSLIVFNVKLPSLTKSYFITLDGSGDGSLWLTSPHGDAFQLKLGSAAFPSEAIIWLISGHKSSTSGVAS